MAGSDQVVLVVGAVVHHDGQILAAHRPAGQHGSAGWEFPGGKVEAGETPQAALVREIREELGIVIAVGDLVARATTDTENGPIDLACYHVTVLGALPTNSAAHDELRWVALDELGTLTWLPPDRPAVQALLA